MKDVADLAETLSTCERRVWDALVSGDAETDAALLDPAFLGVYPTGFARREDHLAQLDEGPSISSYSLSDFRVLQMGQDHAALSYLAEFQRPRGGLGEKMYVTSIWERRAEDWINIFSQDTPVRT